jgi:hypothetical protein
MSLNSAGTNPNTYPGCLQPKSETETLTGRAHRASEALHECLMKIRVSPYPGDSTAGELAEAIDAINQPVWTETCPDLSAWRGRLEWCSPAESLPQRTSLAPAHLSPL